MAWVLGGKLSAALGATRAQGLHWHGHCSGTAVALALHWYGHRTRIGVRMARVWLWVLGEGLNTAPGTAQALRWHYTAWALQWHWHCMGTAWAQLVHGTATA